MATTSDAAQMLINLASQLDPVSRMVTGAAYVFGVGLFVKGLYHMKIYGELRTMMASQTSLRTPLTYFAVGAVFLYFPTALGILLASSFGGQDASILGYSSWVGAGGLSGRSRLAMQAVMRIVQLVGLIAFIRGWLIIAKGAKQGAQVSVGKGITHILGGLMAMNIYGTANVLSATLGVNFGL